MDRAHNPKSQISRRQAAVVGRIITSLGNPINLLVFGLGHDTPFWRSLNANGRTLFVEQTHEWIDIARRSKPEIEVLQFDYQGWTAENSVPIDPVRLESEQIPAQIATTRWDAIVVDAPLGTHPQASGRAVPIFWSQRIMVPHTQIFIDDAERQLEKYYCDLLFPMDQFTKISIPRSSNSERHMLWIARFV